MPPRKTLHAAPWALAVLALATPPASGGEFGAEVLAGYFGMTASKSAEAVFDSSGGFTWGGAGRYALDNGIYVTAGIRTFAKSGQRVFVASPSAPVASLGHPLSVRITPVYLTAGYRFRQGKTIVPYAGLGGSITAYSEQSSVAGLSYDESATKAGFQVVGGVEGGRGRFRFGAEVGWSTVPSTVGVGGVSAIYGEDDIGGWSVLGKVVIAFGGRTPPPPTPSVPGASASGPAR